MLKHIVYFLGLTLLLLMIPASVSASLDSEVRSLLYPEVKEPVKTVIKVEPEPPKPVVYTVIEGDSLTSIATAHGVEWQRLWAKNTQLTNPDLLNIGEQITIPFSDEVLDREVPFTAPVVYSPSYGNGYSYGYCTYGVASWVKVPNNWGNANQWAYSARSQGYTVSNTPVVGSVAQTSAGWAGHVALVVGIGDGIVRIREMNGPAGWNIVGERTTNVRDWVYIYL